MSDEPAPPASPPAPAADAPALLTAPRGHKPAGACDMFWKKGRCSFGDKCHQKHYTPVDVPEAPAPATVSAPKPKPQNSAAQSAPPPKQQKKAPISAVDDDEEIFENSDEYYGQDYGFN